MTDMLPGLAADPDALVAAARAEHRPVRTFCLFSGGHDSTVLAHRCVDEYDELAFIDTGTALPGVVEFVENMAGMLGKPLRILRAGDAFRVMVLGDPDWWHNFGSEFVVWRARHQTARMSDFNDLLRARHGRAQGDGLGNAPHGFPGPAGHRVAYTRLKERCVEQLVRDAKAEFAPGDRLARIMLLTGTRRGESARRARTQKAPHRRVKAQVWCNPLIDWTNEAMRRYRLEHRLPESDVAALMHRSGECNCGAFAAPGERLDLLTFFPEWFEDTILDVEREATRRRLPGAVWGQRPFETAARGGDLCSDCQMRLVTA
jgi:3'-phosphoadenosine 5'-phosphosulfate sulfotransferase (PAPS reductase)/FAD synthetase